MEIELRRRDGVRASSLFTRLFASLLVGAVLIWALAQTGLFERALINPNGWIQLGAFWRAALAPDLSAAFLGVVAGATLTTLAYAVTGLTVSVLLGLLGGVLCSEWLWQRRPRALALMRSALAIPRAIHEALWGLAFVTLIGLDPLSALLAIAIPFGAITAKVFAEILDEAPRAPALALRNAGAGRLQALIYGLLPGATPDMLAYAMYRFECSVRSAAVLGMIGAGGLGFELVLSFQSLNYAQMWTLLYALFALCASTDWWSSQLRRRIGPAHCATWEPGRARADVVRAPFVRASLIAFVALTAAGFLLLRPDVSRLFTPRTLNALVEITRSAFPPGSDLQASDWLRVGAQTLSMAILAAALATLGGGLLAFPAARNFALGQWHAGDTRKPGVARWAVLLGARGALLCLRAIPPPVWALVALFALYPGIAPGALAVGLHTLGILGRLIAEVAEDADPRPARALIASGAGPAQTFAYAALPALLPQSLAYALYRFEIALRESVVVGVVGAGGLGRVLSEQLSSFDYRGIVITLCVLIALTTITDAVSGALRRRIR
jgi:phosphonate transport system permease protein